MKKILSFIIALCISFGYISPFYQVIADNEETYFIVTAYYSPLPDQEHYITGNYEDDIILNGRGIAGASGKKVFSGMLAAPKKYSFGTKILLDGLGIGAVEDRGGAIVPAGQRGYSHDRIDVWMGYGDEGLRRAMYWGKRKVKGTIVSTYSTTTLDYNTIPSPLWVTQNLKHNQIIQKTPDIFDISLGKGSDTARVSELQDILKQIGYLQEDSYLSGEYDDATISAIFEIQLETQILENESSIGAGIYGPRTRKELKNLYEEYLAEEQRKQDFLTAYKLLEQTSLSQAKNSIKNIGKPLYGDISPEVRELQRSLAKVGYFDYKDTAIYGVKTQDALVSYQLEKNIIASPEELGSGVFGPKTRDQLTEDLSKIYLQEIIVSQNLAEAYNMYINVAYTHPQKIDISLEYISISI